MSTQATDLLRVNRGGVDYQMALSAKAKLQATDLLAVSRGGVDYQVLWSNKAKIQATDLLAINRGGVDYQVPWSILKNSFGTPPKITSVVLANAPGAARFTSSAFPLTVTMATDPTPASTKKVKAWLHGNLPTLIKSGAGASSGRVFTLLPPTKTSYPGYNIVTNSKGMLCFDKTDESTCFSVDGVNWRRRGGFKGTIFSTSTGFYRIEDSPVAGVPRTVEHAADGLTWNTVSANNDTISLSGDPSFVESNGITLVFTGETNEVHHPFCGRSTDGVNFTDVARPSFFGRGQLFFKSVCAGGGLFLVAVGATYEPGRLISSADGLTWTEVTMPSFVQQVVNKSAIYGLAYGNGRFFGLYQPVDKSKTMLLGSADGVTWEGHAAPMAPGETAITWYCPNSMVDCSGYAFGWYTILVLMPFKPSIVAGVLCSRDGVDWGFAKAVKFADGLKVFKDRIYITSQVGGTEYFTSIEESYEIRFAATASYSQFAVGDVVYSDPPGASGTVVSTESFDMSVTIDRITGTWASGMKLTKLGPAAPNRTMYCGITRTGAITGVSDSDPGYATVATAEASPGPYHINLTFPATLTDALLPAGTTLTASVQAVDADGNTDSKDSATLTPT